MNKCPKRCHDPSPSGWTSCEKVTAANPHQCEPPTLIERADGDAKHQDCDEFPPASTEQGGKDASSWCVPRTENRSHGGTLGAFYLLCCQRKPCNFTLL